MKKFILLGLFCLSLRAESPTEKTFQPEQIHVVEGTINIGNIQRLLNQGFTVKNLSAYKDGNGYPVAIFVLSPPTPEVSKILQAQKTAEYNRKLAAKTPELEKR